VLDEVRQALDRAPKDRLPVVRVRYLLERGRALNSSKKPAEALPLFREAYDRAVAAGIDFHAIDAAHMVAIVEEPASKRAWNLKGMGVAERTKDKRAAGWLGTLYNNIGWDYHDEGEFEKALETLRKCWDFHKARKPDGPGARIAKWSVAKQLRCLGRLDEALTMQRELFDEYRRLGEEDGFVHEEIAECLLAQGKAEDAKPYFRRAHELLKEIGWVAEDTKRIERLAKLGGG
jgi:tetratricopeptide (TPR) repeat protein